jgi:hypothetical protein
MKLITHIMILTLLVYSLVQASPYASLKQPEPVEDVAVQDAPPSISVLNHDEQLTGRFEAGDGEHLYRLEARPLYAYTFRDEGGLRLELEIVGHDGEVLFSTEDSTDDQSVGAGSMHWDCFDGGSYTVRVIPLHSGTAGDYAFTLEETPGWLAATSLTRFSSLECSLDYPGDVDYYVFERTGDERVYEITVEGGPATVVFWVDTEEGRPEALVQGSEISIIENYPGGGLAETDSYYGVSGPAGYCTVVGSEEKNGGMSTWVILGIVGGVLGIVLIIAVASAAKEGCSNLGNLGNIGCFGN